MVPCHPFTADDFERVVRGRRLAGHWRARVPLDSPLGLFDVNLNAPPDAELLQRVNELASAVSSDHESIVNIIYDDYRRAAEDKQWMKGCEVPRNLREDRVLRYIRRRSISAGRDRHRAVYAELFITPNWELEHGIRVMLANGRLVPSAR